MSIANLREFREITDAALYIRCSERRTDINDGTDDAQELSISVSLSSNISHSDNERCYRSARHSKGKKMPCASTYTFSSDHSDSDSEIVEMLFYVYARGKEVRTYPIYVFYPLSKICYVTCAVCAASVISSRYHYPLLYTECTTEGTEGTMEQLNKIIRVPSRIALCVPLNLKIFTFPRWYVAIARFESSCEQTRITEIADI